MTLAAGPVTIIAITHGNRPARSTTLLLPRAQLKISSQFSLSPSDIHSLTHSLSLSLSRNTSLVSSSFSLCVRSYRALRCDTTRCCWQRHLFSHRASYSRSEKEEKKENCENSRQEQLPFWERWQLATAEIASRNEA